MFTRFLLISILTISFVVKASIPLEVSLRDLACGADHVFVGRVIGVDMIDANGNPILDNEAMTGPGLKNTIRLEVEVLESIESTSRVLPKIIKIPLDQFMHYSLGQIREVYSKPSNPALVFLRGNQFEPVVSGRFLWQLDARKEALELRTHCRSAQGIKQ